MNKEMEKAMAAESVEEEASRAAAAKAASISQINWSFLNANASEWQGRTEKKHWKSDWIKSQNTVWAVV